MKNRDTSLSRATPKPRKGEGGIQNHPKTPSDISDPIALWLLHCDPLSKYHGYGDYSVQIYQCYKNVLK
jgi:hypothetical protein